MRCFVAVELARDLQIPLTALLRGLPPARDVRWCSPEQLHLTLKFLGEVPPEQLDAVHSALRQACRAVVPFPLRLGQLGAFPSPRRPRVAWIGLADPTAGGRRWLEQADPLFTALGFPAEERAFTPHITLGRSKAPAGSRALREVLAGVAAPVAPEMVVREVVLFESRLKPSGAEYTPLARIPLGAGAA